MSELRTIRVVVDPPRPVWVLLYKNSWELEVQWPALLHEWEGVGTAIRRWKGRISVAPEDGPPPSWNPRYPWMFAEKLRPR